MDSHYLLTDDETVGQHAHSSNQAPLVPSLHRRHGERRRVMTDYSELVERLRLTDIEFQRTDPTVLQRRAWDAADAIEALTAERDALRAVTGGLPPELVAKTLTGVAALNLTDLTPDEWVALRAATFEVTE
jgi:hypothetical protein